MPNTISSAKKKSTIAPAIANEEISTPNNPSKEVPANKNTIMMTKATIVALPASIFPPFSFNR